MKTLFVLLVAVSAVAGENLFCTPKKFFKQDCNLCICSNDGKIVGCTKMVCPGVDAINDDATKIQKFCESGKTFNFDEFSTCKCSKDGTKALCTLKLHTLNMDSTVGKNAVYCQPGMTFSPDNCNVCKCNMDGSTAMCSMIKCSDNEVDALTREEQICSPRTTFKDYCNTCTCAADGLSFACTRMFCDKNIWNKDGSLKVSVDKDIVKSATGTRVCAPNTQFKEQCNTCICSNDGLTKVCSMMACEDSETLDAVETVCKPGNIFSPDGCNTCICDEYGTKFACTYELCNLSRKQAHEAEEMEEWGPAYYQGDSCTPGKLFYSECNQCVCLNDGRSALCTLMDCPAKA